MSPTKTADATMKWHATATYPKAPDGYTGESTLESWIREHIEMEQTGVALGPHGIGKTKTFTNFIPTAFPGTKVVRINAANLTPEEIVANAPVNIAEKGKAVQLALRELLMRSLKGHRDALGHPLPYVVVIDDSLQAGDIVANQMMQLACDWTIGTFDLRDYGCIGMFLTDNESLAETAAKRTDIAVLDRMSTRVITANDTSWRFALARKYARYDLKPVFNLWAQMPASIRHMMSPRLIDHLIDVLDAGLPGILALPLLNGERIRFATENGDGKTVDRTTEIIEKVARAIGAPNPEKVDDVVRKVSRLAIQRNWAILIQGDPGTGKTEVVKEVIAEEIGGNPKDYYWSMATTDVEMLCVPIPVEHDLEQLLAEKFYADHKKVFIWDEYNRPKDKAAFAKLMEVTQEWTIAGQAIPGLVAQIAIQNPPYVMGRKLNVSKNNIAQADRFTVSLNIVGEDIPTHEWLLTQFPDKWVDIKLRGLAREGRVLTGEDLETFKSETRQAAADVAESVVEWYKSDIDDEGRQYITARGRERLCKAALVNANLDETKIYLGDGEYAPTVLAGLRSRLEKRPMTGLKELSSNLDWWVNRLEEIKGDLSQGTNDVDRVNMALQFAELSQLEDHFDTCVSLMGALEPKYRTPFLTTMGEKQNFWVKVILEMSNRKAA